MEVRLPILLKSSSRWTIIKNGVSEIYEPILHFEGELRTRALLKTDFYGINEFLPLYFHKTCQDDPKSQRMELHQFPNLLSHWKGDRDEKRFQKAI